MLSDVIKLLWRGIRIARGSMPLTHLFFADDLILMGEATKKSVEAIDSVLKQFCVLSGQRVNRLKSSLVFSGSTPLNMKLRISQYLGVSESASLGKYLGFPPELESNRASSFNFIIERVKSKLEGWRAKFLSKAGRIVLINSVLNSLPTHVMQCTMLPKSVNNRLDRICRNFLWGSTDERKKLHPISWDIVTKPKAEGGLGLRRSEDRNKALVGSLAWRAATSKRP